MEARKFNAGIKNKPLIFNLFFILFISSSKADFSCAVCCGSKMLSLVKTFFRELMHFQSILENMDQITFYCRGVLCMKS